MAFSKLVRISKNSKSSFPFLNLLQGIFLGGIRKGERINSLSYISL